MDDDLTVVDGVPMRIPLNNDARRVHHRVGLSKGCDDTIAAGAGRSKIDKQHLILVVIDDLRQFRLQFHQIAPRQMTFEYGQLKMIAPAAHVFENIPEPFGIANVVTNDICTAHGARV